MATATKKATTKNGETAAKAEKPEPQPEQIAEAKMIAEAKVIHQELRDRFPNDNDVAPTYARTITRDIPPHGLRKGDRYVWLMARIPDGMNQLEIAQLCQRLCARASEGIDATDIAG